MKIDYTITKGEVKHSSTQEIEDLGNAISVVDYLINEGVCFYPSDIITLKQWGQQLIDMANSAKKKGKL